MTGRTKKDKDKLVKMASIRVTNRNLKMKQNPAFITHTHIYEFVLQPEENNTSHEM
jgi:hypothetical protein